MLGLPGLRIFEPTELTDIGDLSEEYSHRVLRVCGALSYQVISLGWQRCIAGSNPMADEAWSQAAIWCLAESWASWAC
jgi:hypothetical protein